MTENEKKPVVEEADVDATSTDVSAETDTAPATETSEEQTVNYLDPDLFKDIKTVGLEDLQPTQEEQDISDDLKEKYLGTFSDISENEVITGRVIGINEKEILVDIGFTAGDIQRIRRRKNQTSN